MAWTKANSQTRTPTSIGRLTVILLEAPDTKEAQYQVEVLDQNGNVMNVPGDSGNLAPHLTQEQVNQLLAFMAMLRSKAIAELIP